MLTSDPALPPKLQSTRRLYRDAPTQSHAFKTEIGLTVSPNFIEAEKVKKKKRNWSKLKGQKKTLEKKLKNETEINLPDKEFKALVLKMLTELEWGEIAH